MDYFFIIHLGTKWPINNRFGAIFAGKAQFDQQNLQKWIPKHVRRLRKMKQDLNKCAVWMKLTQKDRVFNKAAVNTPITPVRGVTSDLT